MATTVDASTRLETRDVTFPFSLMRDEDNAGDGQTLIGYAAVFNSPTKISDQDGDYTETISPGAFKRSIAGKMPKLMFDHGKHPSIGNIPIGTFEVLKEDSRGLYVKAKLIDNPMVNIVRDAIRAGAIDGMSFRFEVVKDSWGNGPARGERTRDLREVKVAELGPVVWPAYADTTAAVRSAVREIAERFPDVLSVEGDDRPELRDDVITTSTPAQAELVADQVEAMWGLDDTTSDCYVTEFYPDHIVFVIVGRAAVMHPGLWSVNYTAAADGTVKLDGDPMHVTAGVPTSADGTQGGTNSAEPVEGEQRAAAEVVDEVVEQPVERHTNVDRDAVVREIALRERGIFAVTS